MKTIGIIGGLSWHSTLVYYREINQLVNQKLGGSHAARILLHSIDFNDFKVLQEKGDWAKIENMFSDIALGLQSAGADFILIGANTPHIIADGLKRNLAVPLLHIAEETAKVLQVKHIKKAGLIGTKFVMENTYFTDRLKAVGIETVIPPDAERSFIHDSIFNELTIGNFNAGTRMKYIEIINRLKEEGAEAIIFACTELSLLIDPATIDIPVFDTTAIHISAAVKFALESA